MPIVSTFCKKGGVGKSTFIAFLGHYYATQGKKVLIISADDQNSIFKIFGADDKIFDKQDDFFEYLLAGKADLGDVLLDVRENLYLIKTLNTDKLSTKLTLERSQEKMIRKIIEEYASWFDYIFIDFPPSSNRLSEVLLDLSDAIIVVVGLDSLGLDGFFNTIQYFYDSDIDVDHIKYIVPNSFSKNRRAPKVSLNKLTAQAADFTKQAVVLPPIYDRAIVKNLQAEGISVFDNVELERYDQKQLNLLKGELLELFKLIDLNKKDPEPKNNLASKLGK